jgi:hypothetical protein
MRSASGVAAYVSKQASHAQPLTIAYVPALPLSLLLLLLLLLLQVLASGYSLAQACISAYTDFAVGGQSLKYGWGFANVVGNYGTDYLMRSVAAYVGLGANWANVSIYPATLVSRGEPVCSGRLGSRGVGKPV